MTSVALLFRMVMVFSVRGAMRYGEGSACNSSLKGDGRIEFFLGMLQRFGSCSSRIILWSGAGRVGWAWRDAPVGSLLLSAERATGTPLRRSE
mmetsp:Transcript_23833/g.52515  ORF Transcript_23833/g.52515 Transcript_23833/m.52515 type:complete len:93 (+) Transcript_23833:1117-1395(+)